ncbi:unnamed protein product [Schistosoma intercalatum]|nr:unnamed protein product [Schistosoma intercalatum]CAH8482283.1 unnamed protein product [Schistosoma intercalatum]
MTLSSVAEKLFQHFNIDTKQWSYSRITVALLAHESFGIGLALGFWIICYKKQPVRCLTSFAPVAIQNIYSKIELVGKKTPSATFIRFFTGRS